MKSKKAIKEQITACQNAQAKFTDETNVKNMQGAILALKWALS